MSVKSALRPGFQSSEHTGCEVTFYTKNAGAIVVDGTGIDDTSPSLINAQTSKALGSAGNFALGIKAPLTQSLFDAVSDDDWCDITFTKHGTRWHTMRAQVDDIRCAYSVGGTGATTRNFTVTGRDFQKIFDSTQIWFDQFTAENVQGGQGMQVFSGSENISFGPQQSVEAFLQGYLQAINSFGRANWVLPDTMPNIPSSRAFVEAVNFDTNIDGDYVPRVANSLNFNDPNGNAWSLASQWSDPTFCEMFTELYPSSGSIFPGQDSLKNGLSLTDSQMCVVLRYRPYVTVSSETGMPGGKHSPWFTLPIYKIPRQWVTTENTGRGGFERYNAFFCSTQVSQEVLKEIGLGIVEGTWDTGSIHDHGLRRFDVTSQYEPNDYDGLSQLKYLARDWYCNNHNLYNGTISLGCGMPDIRVGTRARVLGDTPATDHTYYVEGVAHNWAQQAGMRTSLTVTRGYFGTDEKYISDITEAASTYTSQLAATAGEPGVNVADP